MRHWFRALKRARLEAKKTKLEAFLQEGPARRAEVKQKALEAQKQLEKVKAELG